MKGLQIYMRKKAKQNFLPQQAWIAGCNGGGRKRKIGGERDKLVRAGRQFGSALHKNDMVVGSTM